MKKIKWGVLGLSGHYRLRVHLPLSNWKRSELYAVASRDAERAEAAAAELGFKKSYGSYESLLDDNSVDAVYLPLPNNLHLEWIKKAADAGKHIVCEKPLCLTSAEVDEAFSYCADKGVFLMEAFMFRFHPQWLRVKEIIDTGEIGTVKSIQCLFSYDNTDPENIRNKPEHGGGAVRDIGCYGIAVSNFLLGTDPINVQAMINTDSVFGTDQLASFMLDFGNCHSLVTVSTQMHSAQNVRITGTSGSVEVLIPFNMYNDVPARVKIISGVGERIMKTEIADQYLCEFERFTNAVSEDDRAFFEMMKSFSIRNQRVIDAVFKAGAE